MECEGILGSLYKPSSWLTKNDDKISGVIAHTSNLSIWKKEDQKSKPTLAYTVSLWLAWDTRDPKMMSREKGRDTISIYQWILLNSAYLGIE